MENSIANESGNTITSKINSNPLRLICKKCGAPLGFDIINQTYGCNYCGEKAKTCTL